MPRRAAPLSRIRPYLQVDLIFRDRRTGRFTRRLRFKNTLTDYAVGAIAGLIAQVGCPPPLYMALGNGSGTPSHTDIAAFAEVDGTRQYLSSLQQYQTVYAMGIGFFPSTTPAVDYTEAIWVDAAVGSAAVGSSGVSSGTKTLPLGSNAPAVTGGASAGSRTTAYINDGASSEYVQIATSAAAGASSWTLAANLQYSHAATTPIVVFGGNVWAHVLLSNADLSAGGETLTVQWKILVAGN